MKKVINQIGKALEYLDKLGTGKSFQLFRSLGYEKLYSLSEKSGP